MPTIYRTKLKERILPTYTRTEETFNMVSHIVGAGFGIAVLLACVVISAWRHNPIGIASSVVYGATMVMLYTMSSIYHGLADGIAKRVFQVLDHCSIYLLISGTYTPILLVAFLKASPVIAWSLFGLEWGLALFAITLTAIDLKKFQLFSMICYIGMGWSVVIFSNIAIAALGTIGFTLLMAGGVSYTIGAILYAIGKKKKNVHSVFHVFVVVGSLFHAACIMLYAL